MKKKKLGLGTLSLLLAATGVAWGFTFNGYCLGDEALRLVGLPAWSGGNTRTHYTVYYSLAFFVPAFLLGLRNKSDFGSLTGRALSAILGVLLILTVFGLTV